MDVDSQEATEPTNGDSQVSRATDGDVDMTESPVVEAQPGTGDVKKETKLEDLFEDSDEEFPSSRPQDASSPPGISAPLG